MSRRVGLRTMQPLGVGTQLVRAIKYDGYANATSIIAFLGTQYDGYANATSITDFLATQYDGYSVSSVSI